MPKQKKINNYIDLWVEKAKSQNAKKKRRIKMEKMERDENMTTPTTITPHGTQLKKVSTKSVSNKIHIKILA